MRGIRRSTAEKPRLIIAGLSLVETVLALSIFSFALVAMLGLIPVASSTLNRSLSTSTSSNIAQAIVANLNRQSWSTLASGPGSKYFFDDTGTEIDQSNPDIVYTATVSSSGASVNSHSDFATTNLLKVRIAIQSTRSGNQPLIFSTIIANRGQ